MIHEALFDSFPGDPDGSPQKRAGHIWVVEQFYNKAWEPVGGFMLQDENGEPYIEFGAGGKREYARDVARRIRERGREVRVVPYTSNFDSQGRVNRQVFGERKS